MRKPCLFAFVSVAVLFLSNAVVADPTKPILVLVSGFRLSWAQQALARAYLLSRATVSEEWLSESVPAGNYFSASWLDEARGAGFEPVVIDATSAKKSIEENAAVVSEAIVTCCSKRPFWVLSHSAGTLYVIEGLRKTPLRPQGMVWMASPVLGHPVIDEIQRSWFGRRLLRAVEGLGYPLSELSSKSIERFWRRQPEWDPQIPILAEFHTQPLPQNRQQLADPQFISPRLFALGKMLDRPSDGVVPLPPSGTPRGLSVMWGGKERFVPYEVWSEGSGLDHTEEYANLETTLPAAVTLQPRQTEFVRSVMNWLEETLIQGHTTVSN